MKQKSRRWIWRSRCNLNWAKIKFEKKLNFWSSVRNGRFCPLKCRGKLQKMGVLYPHSPKMPSPSPDNQFFYKKNQKNGKMGANLQFDRLLNAADRSFFFPCCLPPFFPTFGHFGQLHLIGFSTCPPCPNFFKKLETPIIFDP
jgi:hypothetical protein